MLPLITAAEAQPFVLIALAVVAGLIALFAVFRLVRGRPTTTDKPDDQ